MHKDLINWLSVFLLISACSNRRAPEISVVCEENNVGNYIIKWEIYPAMSGKVKVYESTDPFNIPEDLPVAMTDINKQRVTIITENPNRRHYYLLVFDDKYKVNTSSRHIKVSGKNCFNDIGGYQTENKQNTRWGMIYRTSLIDSTNAAELQNIGARTIINMKKELCRASGYNVINFHVSNANITQILKDLQEGKIKNDTLNQIIRRLNNDLVINHKQEYKKLFDILLDQKNYPVVIQCSCPDNNSGVASSLIFAALGVKSEEMAIDYRCDLESENAELMLPTDEKSISSLSSAQDKFLNAGKKLIKLEYKDIFGYLEKSIGLNHDEINKLREILLQ